ncbi:MAG TPA: hypothetical protein VKY57_12470 [Chitinispirillaceae bacterium]|nr:hypothetical protein [Chitinispirillaceae bacterium]
MNTNDSILSVITFDNDKFFELNKNDMEKLSWDKLPDFDGIVINSPDKIDVSKHVSFPVVAATGYNGERNASLMEERNIIASVLGKNGSFFIGSAIHRKKAIKYPEPNEDNTSDESFKDVHYAGCEIYNLKKSLNLPLITDIYQVVFFYYDWFSNISITNVENENEPNIFNYGKNTLPDINLPLKPYSGNNAFIDFTLPQKIRRNDKKVNLSLRFRLPVEGKDKNDNNVNSRKIKLIFIKRNQDQKPVLNYEFSLFGSNEMDSKDTKLCFEGEYELEIGKHILNDFSISESYCCYLITWGFVSGPVFVDIIE